MKMKLLLALLIAWGVVGGVSAQEPVDETPRGPLAADKEMPDSNDATAGGVESRAVKAQPLVSSGANGSGLSPEQVSGDLSALRAKLTEQAAENAVQGAHLLDEPANVRDLLRLRTLDFLGLAACQNLVKTQDGTQFLVWLLNDDALMQEAAGSYPTGSVHQAAPKGTAELWLKIWLQQTFAERENYRRLACGVAVAHAVPVKAVGGGVIDPIARYRWFRDADQAGQLLHYFRQANVRELENITGVARTDADLEWAHQNVPRSNQTMAKCGYHIHYTRFNKDGVSVQKGKPFYDYKPKTFPVLAEYGGVCGAISTVNTDVRRAFGVPSFTVGQPGHCAYITKKKPDEWCIGNNIFGWTKSTHADRFEPWGSSGDYMRIYRDITRDIDALRRAELLITTADATSDNTAKRACLDAAIDLVPRHFGAWEKLAALHPDDVDALKVRAAQVFDDFATPDSDLIKEFDNSGQPRISRFRPRKRK